MCVTILDNSLCSFFNNILSRLVHLTPDATSKRDYRQSDKGNLSTSCRAPSHSLSYKKPIKSCVLFHFHSHLHFVYDDHAETTTTSHTQFRAFEGHLYSRKALTSLDQPGAQFAVSPIPSCCMCVCSVPRSRVLSRTLSQVQHRYCTRITYDDIDF